MARVVGEPAKPEATRRGPACPPTTLRKRNQPHCYLDRGHGERYAGRTCHGYCVASAWPRRHRYGPSSSFPSRPIFSTSRCFGDGMMFSKLATHGLGRPSASLSGTSVGISRIRVVTGATGSVVRRGMTESRVRIMTGRRLSPGLSANQTPSRGGSTLIQRPREGQPIRWSQPVRPRHPPGGREHSHRPEPVRARPRSVP